MENKMVACFFALGEDKFDYLEDTLNSYDIGRYIIGFEVTNDNKKKEHFHILFEGTDKIYNAFSKKIVEDNALRCKGKGNKKYGKVKEIRDFEKMCSYTLKGGNFRGTFTDEEITNWYEKSFDEKKKRDISAEIFAYLDKEVNDNCTHMFEDKARLLYEKISKLILRFLIENQYHIGTLKTYIQRHTFLWLQNNPRMQTQQKINTLFYLIN